MSERNTKPRKVVFRPKRVIQDKFVEQCRKDGLTSSEMIERASVFPFGVPSMVLEWPKL